MRLSGIKRVDSVTTTKCYKGPRRENMKALEWDGAPRKCSRLRSSQPSEVSCFFCGQAAGTDGLHEVTTFARVLNLPETVCSWPNSAWVTW